MENLPIHFLYPAELYVSKTPYQVNTILGSCVSVCLYDPTLNIGGINHFMLPYWNGQGLASPKYGNIAIDRLVDKMLSLGCNKINLKAKIFGGGEVIETNIVQFHIGQRNIEVAKTMLDELKIPILSSSVGGKLGRKIEFYTSSGDVRQKYVQKSTQVQP
jgi:chemotaxis protein CheD